MDQTSALLVAGFAGLLCLGAVVLLAMAGWMYTKRQEEAAQPSRPNTPAPVTPSGRLQQGQSANLPGDDFVPEDELPTVVVSSPPPPPPRPAALEPNAPPPQRRTSGATIIAFDDDDDDDA